MYRYIPKKTLNIDLFHVKKKYLYPVFLLQLHLVASYFIQNILHVTWPLSWTMQCFIHLCNTSALLQADNKDHVRGHPQFTHRWAPLKAELLHNEWNMQMERNWSHFSFALQYVPYQTETSIAETRKEEKQESKWEKVRGLRRWTLRKFSETGARAREEHLFGNDESWPKGLTLRSICLNCSLEIACWYYLIIVANEPQQKIIMYQSVDHYVSGVSPGLSECVNVPLRRS